MFDSMIESVATRMASKSKVMDPAAKDAKEKSKAGRKSRATRSARLDATADAFLAKHGYDVGGNPSGNIK